MQLWELYNVKSPLVVDVSWVKFSIMWNFFFCSSVNLSLSSRTTMLVFMPASAAGAASAEKEIISIDEPCIQHKISTRYVPESIFVSINLYRQGEKVTDQQERWWEPKFLLGQVTVQMLSSYSFLCLAFHLSTCQNTLTSTERNHEKQRFCKAQDITMPRRAKYDNFLYLHLKYFHWHTFQAEVSVCRGWYWHKRKPYVFLISTLLRLEQHHQIVYKQIKCKTRNKRPQSKWMQNAALHNFDKDGNCVLTFPETFQT